MLVLLHIFWSSVIRYILIYELYSFMTNWYFHPYEVFFLIVGVQSLSRVWTRCNNTPDFPVLHYLPEFAQIHVHCVGDAIQPSHPLLPSSPFTFNPSQHPMSRHPILPMSWHFVTGGQSIGPSASASVIPLTCQAWFSLGLTGLISL